MATPEKTYPRFTLSQCLEHWIMSLSFTVLGLTGLPQRYALSFWADPLLRLFGGIEAARIIHRIAAIIFVAVTAYHLVAVAYKIFVLRVRLSMLPGLKDLTDMLQTIRHNLGLTREHPKYPRYSFAEKTEYWALIWGAVLMSLTGFMLWNPIATTQLLPGEFIPAAKAAHSAEALLAALAVLIWHVYGVHIRTFNTSMFTGTLSEKEMREEHAAELEEIDAGRLPPPVPPEVRRRRERFFLPVAAVAGLIVVIGLYTFTTFEQTAIATVPPAETAPIVAPASALVPPPPQPPSPSPEPPPEPAELPPIGEVSFASDLEPLLQAECTICHGERLAIAGLKLTDYQSFSTGGQSGPPFVPGSPEQSLVIAKLQGKHPVQLTSRNLEMLKAWIAAGAQDN
ncbi:MAG: hypothetical protein HY335_11230 [Deinococcus sp.]|nr:hypothetical protein [Deinococcus sp.]